MNEYIFDINEWLPKFPLDSYDPELIPSGYGPQSICLVEQIRRIAVEHGDLGRSVPTDVFILALGEPDRRDVTKVGGLPYRPRGLPWPISKDTGDPLIFVAQFRFNESRDIIGETPGDILLTFFDGFCAVPYDECLGPPVFEWYSLAIEDLIEPEEIPKQKLGDFPICYGVRHRTVDYLDDSAVDLLRSVTPLDFLELYEDDPDEEIRSRVRGWFGQQYVLKIGGSPWWRDPEEVEREGVVPGRFLATIPQIIGGFEGPYPWLNCAQEEYDVPSLFWAGEGLMHLFLDEHGTVQPRFDLYSYEQ